MSINADCRQLTDTLASELPLISKELSRYNISAVRSDKLTVSKTGKDISITYTADNQFFRALSHLRGIDPNADFQIAEQAEFGLLSFMLDCSRNAVMKLGAFKELTGLLAMMGYNSIMLYTEDTYEIPSEPYFGHLRGRYSQEEMRAMDSYAAQFGIELIPCIQTLAHLNAMFKWPVYGKVWDTADILLCDSELTYNLIDSMFSSLAQSFKSRRINIGMDEAHLVGLGKYLDRNGFKNRTEIMLRHLNKVVEIAAKYGFKCCMWSDMFFRLAYNGQYYPAMDAPRFDKSVTQMVPKDVELIYWDYYHKTVEEYDDMFSRHFDFDNKVIFAGGAWRWHGITPNNKFGLKRVIPGLIACRKNKINEVIVTCWGDNGNETSFYSALPQILVYAEYCYNENPDEAYLNKRMLQTADASYSDLLLLDIAGTPHDYEDYDKADNISKTLLYNDPLLGIMDESAYEGIGADYTKAAQVLTDAGKRNKRWKYMFDTQAALCSLLSLKAGMVIELKAAYDRADAETLTRLAETTIPQTIKRAQGLMDAMRKQWYSEAKTFGFEVIQIRIGGVKERLNETMLRLKEYLSDKIDRIEELEQPRLKRDPDNGSRHNNNYISIATPSML